MEVSFALDPRDSGDIIIVLKTVLFLVHLRWII